MKKFAISVACFGLCCLIAVAGGAKDGGKIEGKWNATGGSSDGKKIPQEIIDKIMLVVTFKDGKYSVTVGDKQVESGTYKIDASKKPAAIDMLIAEGKDKDKKQLAIYKIEADKLTVAIGAAGSDKRPKDFEGADGVEITYLKRSK